MRLASIKTSVLALAVFSVPFLAPAALVDTDGNAVTNQTALGDIDMAASTYGDLKNGVAPGYGTVSNAAVNAASNERVNNLQTALDLAATAATNYTDSAAAAAVTTAVATSKTYTDSSTNAVIQHVDAMDTSYFRFETITNVNQSVQYVATDANTTELRILMPATGMTKDWLVYIYPAADLNIVLPGPADYWCSSYDVTNSIPAGVPTALYFSQITEGVFSLGRKKLDCPITVSSPLTARLRQSLTANRRAALTARRPTPTATALKTAAKPATATAAKPTATAVKPATTNTTATAAKK